MALQSYVNIYIISPLTIRGAVSHTSLMTLCLGPSRRRFAQNLLALVQNYVMFKLEHGSVGLLVPLVAALWAHVTRIWLPCTQHCVLVRAANEVRI